MIKLSYSQLDPTQQQSFGSIKNIEQQQDIEKTKTQHGKCPHKPQRPRNLGSLGSAIALIVFAVCCHSSQNHTGADRQDIELLERLKAIQRYQMQRSEQIDESQTVYDKVQSKIQNDQQYYSRTSIDQLIKKSDLRAIYSNVTDTIHGITLEMHLQAIRMLQLNNDYEIKTDEQRLLLSQEHSYYDAKYQIDLVKSEKQVAFCVIVPLYNSIKYLKRNLISILGQNYTQFTVYYVDDHSETNITHQIHSIIDSLRLSQQKHSSLLHKLKISRNEHRLYALHNIYNTVHSNCQDHEIVVLVDGDDALVGRQVLSLLNAIYQDALTRPLIVYSKYLHMEKGMASLGMVSRPIRPGNFIKNRLRKDHTFCTSHLLTFSAHLFKQILPQDLHDSEGNFFKTAYDVAIITPMLQMAYPHIKYLPQILYEYHYDGVSNDHRQQQKQVSKMIFEQKTPYQKFNDLMIAKMLA